MKKPLEAVTAAQTANAETAIALMRNTLDAIERLAALNLNTMRDALDDSSKQSGKLGSVKDLGDTVQPGIERTRAYYHQVYDLMSEMQEQLTQVMQAHYSALSESASSASKSLAAGAPVGGEAFAAAMKTMLDASAQAFERLNETTHQLQAGARELGKAATSSATAAAKASTSGRAKKS
jgi:phasin family protein